MPALLLVVLGWLAAGAGVLALMALIRQAAGLRRVRGLPGPAPWPLVGNLPTILRLNQNLDDAIALWRGKYGKIFRFSMGAGTPWVVVADVARAREVMLKKHTWFVNRPSPSGVERFAVGKSAKAFFRWSMTVVKDAEWRGIRRAATAVFHSDAILERFAPAVNRAADRFVEGVKDRPRDEQGWADVEVWRPLGEMTLEVICATAFGLSFDDEGMKSRQMELLRAAKTFFDNAGIFGNPYMLVAGMLPAFLHAPLGVIARTFPTASMRTVGKALEAMERHSEELLAAALEEEDGRGADPPAPEARSLELRAGESVLNLMIREWRGSQGGDDVDQQRRARLAPELREHWVEAIRAQAALLFAAGYETTANTLSFTLYLLGRHPHWYERIQKEVDEVCGSREGPPSISHADAQERLPVTFACIQEAIRLFPPVPLTSRICEPPAHAAGASGAWLEAEVPGEPPTFVPRGGDVVVAIRAIHLDPEVFENPRRFDPSRFIGNKAHPAWMPFGHGPRQCVAMKLALTEAVVALSHFAAAFDLDVPAAPHLEDDVAGLQTRVRATLSPGEAGVRLRVRPRAP